MSLFLKGWQCGGSNKHIYSGIRWRQITVVPLPARLLVASLHPRSACQLAAIQALRDMYGWIYDSYASNWFRVVKGRIGVVRGNIFLLSYSLYSLWCRASNKTDMFVPNAERLVPMLRCRTFVIISLLSPLPASLTLETSRTRKLMAPVTHL